MKIETENAIKEYQCSGCIHGSNLSCYEKESSGIGCGKHLAGTMEPGIGFIFLGLPLGFNRLGKYKDLKPNIYETFESSKWCYDKFNIPVWKYLSEKGHTFVRGFMPRLNEPFIHIFLENCVNKINCYEVTQNDLEKMD